jgi:hypothetical protein
MGISAHLTVPEFGVNGIHSGKPAPVWPRELLTSLILQSSMLSLASVGGRYGIVLVVVVVVVVAIAAPASWVGLHDFCLPFATHLKDPTDVLRI